MMRRSPLLLGLPALLALTTITAMADFTAYNDCTASAGNPTNTTTYRGQPDGAGFMKDFATGATLPVTLTVVSSGLTYGGGGGPMPNAGTDCYNTFDGKVVFNNVAYYGTWMEARFTGLDPNKEYEFATSVNRGNVAYTTRTTQFTLSDIDSATQSSTPGVTVNSPTSVTFNAGYNTVTGYVARWTKIKCGADGDFTVRTDNGAGTSNGYAMDGLMLRESFGTTHFTVTADPRSNHAGYNAVLTGIKNTLAAVGAFHVDVGDFDPPANNRAQIDAVFGSNYLWFTPVGNHETESATNMDWVRAEYNTGNGVRTPLKNSTLQNGPTGSVETMYSVDVGNAHLVFLNEYWNGGTGAGSDVATDGDVVLALRDWLDADLKATTKPVKIVFGHEPAHVPAGHNHYGDSLDAHVANRDAFWNILKTNKVLAMLNGHTHDYYKLEVDGVWQLDAGNAGNDNTGDGYTFIDVILSTTTVQFDVWRDTAKNGTWVKSAESFSVPVPSSAKDITSFTFPGLGAATIAGTAITMTVPYATVVTALSPTYTLSAGASCVPVSNPSPGLDFTSPVHYLVTAEDLSTKDYTVTVTVTPPDATWITDGSGLWSTTTNWLAGLVPDGTGSIARFHTIDITADRTVSLDTTRTVGSMFFGDTDTASPAGWTLGNNGNPANILTLAGTAPTITVNTLAADKTATISAELAAASGLTKNGAGTLVLAANNLYSGPTAVTAGIIKAGIASVANTSGAFGINSAVTLANTAGAALDITGFDTRIGSLAGGGGTGGNVILGDATLTVGDNNSTTTYAGVISSSAGVTGVSLNKIGTGRLTLQRVNTYAGKTVIDGGTLAVDDTSNIDPDGKLGTVPATFQADNITIRNGGTLYWIEYHDGPALHANRGIHLETGVQNIICSYGDFYVNGVISGPGGLMHGNIGQGGYRRLYLNAANTFTGDTKWDASGSAANYGGIEMVNPLALQNSAIDADSVASWISVPSVLTIGGLVNGTRSTASLFNNAAVTSLTLNPTLAGVTKTFTNVISGAPGMTLTKTGAGTQVLGGLNTYTGDTIVKEGTLSITQAYLADASTVRIGILPGDSAVLDLNHALTDTVAQLFIDGVPMPAGTHGSTASTATYKDATAFLGTGVLNVTSGPSGFASWVGGYGLTLGNAAAAFDHDLDGLDNAVEYVLGTNPAVANAGGPSGSTTGGAFVFTFQRSLASKTPDTVVAIEVGTTLAAWPLVYQVDTAPEVTITPGPTGYETVTLTVTRAPDASKFARLRVTVTDP